MSELPTVPLDDVYLDLYAEALTSTADVDEDGNLTRSGFGLQQVLDFVAGHDPTDVTVLGEGDPEADDPWRRARFVACHSPTYSVEDLLSALIGEVHRLRRGAP